MEEILQKISEYWAVFVASGAYVTLSAYGAILIKQLFTKATANRVVTQITDGLLASVLFIKEKVSKILKLVRKIFNNSEETKQMLIDFIAEQRAFNQTMLDAHDEEQRRVLVNSYEANLSRLTPVTQEVEQEVEEDINEVVEPVVEAETRKERKKRIKADKKDKREVKNEEITELY